MCNSNSQIIICFENKQQIKRNNYFHFLIPGIKTITLNVLVSILMKKNL